MSGVFKRLMNVLTIIVVLLTVLNYPWTKVDITYVSMSWIFVLAINYVFFKKLTIWHRDS